MNVTDSDNLHGSLEALELAAVRITLHACWTWQHFWDLSSSCRAQGQRFEVRSRWLSFVHVWLETKKVKKEKGYPFLGHQNCSNFDDKKMRRGKICFEVTKPCYDLKFWIFTGDWLCYKQRIFLNFLKVILYHFLSSKLDFLESKKKHA